MSIHLVRQGNNCHCQCQHTLLLRVIADKHHGEWRLLRKVDVEIFPREMEKQLFFGCSEYEASLFAGTHWH